MFGPRCEFFAKLAILLLTIILVCFRTIILLSENSSSNQQLGSLSLRTSQDTAGSDASTLIDLPDFHYIINNLLCNHTASLVLLVLVVSAPNHQNRRATIRRTWGRYDERHRVAFLLGDDVSHPETQKLIDVENNLHRDIIQGSFTDTYHNLTYKHVMALKWTTYFCPQARYLFKMDDDVFVNMATLLAHLHDGVPPRRLMLCKVHVNPLVYRDNSKWSVSVAEYPEERYPSYCAGCAVLYSADVVTLLYLEAQRTPFFWIEDVHVTGTVVARINNKTNNILRHRNAGAMKLTRLQMKMLKVTPKKFLFGPCHLNELHLQTLWDITQDLKQRAENKSGQVPSS